MKKKIALILVFTLLLFLGTSASYRNGVYTGAADGFAGEVKVKVTVRSSRIRSVEVVSHSETQGIGSRAVEALPAVIVEKQTPEVDAVAGATITSNAIKEAVRQALGL